MSEIKKHSRWVNVCGSKHPFYAWGRVFRKPATELIERSGKQIKSISFIAMGQKENDELAHVHWGRLPEDLDLVNAFGEQAVKLRQNGLPLPSWQEEFDEPFEDFKARSSQEDLGLLAVAYTRDGHKSRAETATFDMPQESAALALEGIGDRLVAKAAIILPNQNIRLQEAA